jgi:hypothetical protein
MSEERRRFQRVSVNLTGRYMLADRRASSGRTGRISNAVPSRSVAYRSHSFG